MHSDLLGLRALVLHWHVIEENWKADDSWTHRLNASCFFQWHVMEW
jgi:hypothetical protein